MRRRRAESAPVPRLLRLPTRLRSSGRPPCVELHGEACLKLAIMLHEISLAPARAVRPDPNGSGEDPVPLPAPDAVGGNAVTARDLINGQEQGLLRSLRDHAYFGRDWDLVYTGSIRKKIKNCCWDFQIQTKRDRIGPLNLSGYTLAHHARNLAHM
jgi:hypothetical protein